MACSIVILLTMLSTVFLFALQVIPMPHSILGIACFVAMTLTALPAVPLTLHRFPSSLLLISNATARASFLPAQHTVTEAPTAANHINRDGAHSQGPIREGDSVASCTASPSSSVRSLSGDGTPTDIDSSDVSGHGHRPPTVVTAAS